MAALVLSQSQQRRLVACWREAGLALAQLRHAELASRSAAESREAAHDMLHLGGMLPADRTRELGSGLVEMQRLFSRGHGRGRP